MQYKQYHLPQYDYNIVGNEINYFETDDSTLYTGIGNYKVTNGLQSETQGLELMLWTKKIKAIQTSFNFNAAYNYGTFKSLNERIIPLATYHTDIAQLDALYAVYPAANSIKQSLMSKVGSVTHLPKLGFVITLNADIYWMNSTQRNYQDGIPIAYINKNMETIDLTQINKQDPIFDKFKLEASDEVNDKQYMVYGILNASIAKEINKKIRLSINAYNFLNLLPQHYRMTQSGTIQSVNYTERVSINAGLTIKL